MVQSCVEEPESRVATLFVGIVFGETDNTDVINGSYAVELSTSCRVCASVLSVVVSVEEHTGCYFVNDRPEEDTVHVAGCFYPRVRRVPDAFHWNIDSCGCVMGEHEVYPASLLLECQGVSDSGFYIHAGDVFVREPIFPSDAVLPVDTTRPAEPKTLGATEIKNGATHDADNIRAELLKPVFYSWARAVCVEWFVITVYEEHCDTLLAQKVIEFGELCCTGDETEVAELHNSIGSEPLAHVNSLVFDPAIVSVPVTSDHSFGGVFEVFPNVCHVLQYTRWRGFSL